MIQSLHQPRVSSDSPASSQPPATAAPAEANQLCDDEEPEDFREISDEEFQQGQTAYAKLRKETPEGQPLPPPPLNPEQRCFAREQLRAQRILAAGRTAGEDRGASLQKLFDEGLRQVSLLHGPGGSGKSVLLFAQERILTRYKLGTMATTAWTGVAATPFRAPTLCTLLGIEFAKLHQEPRKDEKQMGRIRTDFALYYGEPSDLLVFVVDEVSFLDPAALRWLDMLLRWLVNQPPVPFGGVLVQLAGDFWQKAPPAGTSLAELLVSVDAPVQKSKNFPPTSSMAKGLHIFRHARRTLLTRQMRAAEDTEFQEVLTCVRSTETEPPIPNGFVRDLKELSIADVAADPARAFAPIIVLGNQERLRLNHHQAYAFAKTYDLPLVRWRLPLVGKEADAMTSETLDALMENEVGLWQYYVRGAPCMLLQNVQPTKSMANGSMGFMHSLSFEDTAPPELAEAEASSRFCVIDLPQPPFTINIQLSLASDDDGAGIESMTTDATVVPVQRSRALLEYETGSLFATMSSVPRVLRHHGHPITLAFALTDFKVQGRTLDYLNLSIAARPFPPHLDMKGFYVMISRVRRSSSLRVLSRHDDLRHLLNLRHAKELAVWHASYSAVGDWDAGLARTNAQLAAKRKPAPKKRAFCAS